MCVEQKVGRSEHWVDSGYCERGLNCAQHEYEDEHVRYDLVGWVHDRRQVLNGHGNTRAQGIKSSTFEF